MVGACRSADRARSRSLGIPGGGYSRVKTELLQELTDRADATLGMPPAPGREKGTTLFGSGASGLLMWSIRLMASPSHARRHRPRRKQTLRRPEPRKARIREDLSARFTRKPSACGLNLCDLGVLVTGSLSDR